MTGTWTIKGHFYEIQAPLNQRKKYIDKLDDVDNKSHLVSFHESILVSLGTFQPTLVYKYIYNYWIRKI